MPQTDRAKELGIDLAALKGVTQDSREVKEDYLFAALKGEKVDGRAYIQSAIARGASVILTDTKYDAPKGVQIVISNNPKRDLSHIAAAFYAPLPEHIIAVTGTNGKSSVVHFAAQLWQKLGINGAMMGTLTGKLTTPDPVSLLKELGRLKQEGTTHVAIEASSHGLSQHRVDGVPIDVAAFTNFTQDHLDYHIDMDGYFTAKTRLFEEILPISGAAVLNADVSSSYASLKDTCKRRGIRVISYGEQGEDIKLEKRNVTGVAQEISLGVMGQHYNLTIPFVGAFQIMNMLCALGCLMATRHCEEARPTKQSSATKKDAGLLHCARNDISELIEALPTLEGVPGRLQHISDGTYNAYVDYAHTPDALETVLNALRPHTDNRLICVFGCGGDRDTSKRPQMGEIAARLADIAIITDDNPRTENAGKIREQVEAGIPPEYTRHCEEQSDEEIQKPDVQESGLLRCARNDDCKILNIGDRRSAIEKAVSIMQEGDILLLAGKGHETGQIIGNEIHPFDDRDELSNALKNKKGTSNLQ